MYFNQYEINEGGRGLGRTFWIKQEGRAIGEGLGLLRDIRLFPLILSNILIFWLWFNPFNTQIDQHVISHNVVT